MTIDSRRLVSDHQSHTTRSWHGHSQKSLHFKAALDVLEALDAEAHTSGLSRNNLINKACRWYCQAIDDARKEIAAGFDAAARPPESLDAWMLDRLTVGKFKKLRHITSTLGTTTEDLVQRLVERMMDDFDKRPFEYI